MNEDYGLHLLAAYLSVLIERDGGSVHIHGGEVEAISGSGRALDVRPLNDAGCVLVTLSPAPTGVEPGGDSDEDLFGLDAFDHCVRTGDPRGMMMLLAVLLHKNGGQLGITRAEMEAAYAALPEGAVVAAVEPGGYALRVVVIEPEPKVLQ